MSAVLVSFGHGEELPRAVASLERLGEHCCEVLVVDNAGDLGEARLGAVGGAPLRLLKAGRNLGFAGAVNRAAASSRGELLLLLSPDAELLEYDGAAVDAELAAGAGAVGAATEDQAGRLGVSWGEFPGLGRMLRSVLGLRRLADRRRLARLRRGRRVRVDWVLGAAVVLPRRVLSELGGLDERYRAAGDDQDLGWRLERRGMARLVSPHWRVRHRPRDPRSPEMAAEILRNDLRWVSDHSGPVDRLAVGLRGRLHRYDRRRGTGNG